MAAADINGRKGIPLFCTLDRRRNLTETRMDRREALAMIKRRAKKAGLPDSTSCHTFRATGITTYLLNGVQYLVVVAGGGQHVGHSGRSDQIIAFRLPAAPR